MVLSKFENISFVGNLWGYAKSPQNPHKFFLWGFSTAVFKAWGEKKTIL